MSAMPERGDSSTKLHCRSRLKWQQNHRYSRNWRRMQKLAKIPKDKNLHRAKLHLETEMLSGLAAQLFSTMCLTTRYFRHKSKLYERYEYVHDFHQPVSAQPHVAKASQRQHQYHLRVTNRPSRSPDPGVVANHLWLILCAEILAQIPRPSKLPK